MVMEEVRLRRLRSKLDTVVKRILIKRAYQLHIIWEHSTYSLSLIPCAGPEIKETYEITLTCFKQRILTIWQ